MMGEGMIEAVVGFNEPGRSTLEEVLWLSSESYREKKAKKWLDINRVEIHHHPV